MVCVIYINSAENTELFLKSAAEGAAMHAYTVTQFEILSDGFVTNVFILCS